MTKVARKPYRYSKLRGATRSLLTNLQKQTPHFLCGGAPRTSTSEGPRPEGNEASAFGGKPKDNPTSLPGPFHLEEGRALGTSMKRTDPYLVKAENTLQTNNKDTFRQLYSDHFLRFLLCYKLARSPNLLMSVRQGRRLVPSRFSGGAQRIVRKM